MITKFLGRLYHSFHNSFGSLSSKLYDSLRFWTLHTKPAPQVGPYSTLQYNRVLQYICTVVNPIQPNPTYILQFCSRFQTRVPHTSVIRLQTEFSVVAQYDEPRLGSLLLLATTSQLVVVAGTTTTTSSRRSSESHSYPSDDPF